VKQVILLSPDTESSSSGEPVKRLATRYGIPEKDVEALLYGSRAPKAEALGFDIKDKTMPEDFRPDYGTPSPRRSWWSPLNVLSVIVGILGIMALSIILIRVIQDGRHNYHEFGNMMPPPPMIMHPNAPHPAMPDTSLAIPRATGMNEKQDDVPPPASVNEIEKTPAPKKHRSASIRHSSGGGFTTSNSIEAQERLAEMRADGNSKAKIHEKTKNGVTTYNVK